MKNCKEKFHLVNYMKEKKVSFSRSDKIVKFNRLDISF